METVDIVNAIAAGNKLDAIDKINDHLYAKAAQAMKNYKEVLAQSFFAEPETSEELEQGTEE